jgi:hypothetical protein
MSCPFPGGFVVNLSEQCWLGPLSSDRIRDHIDADLLACLFG